MLVLTADLLAARGHAGSCRSRTRRQARSPIRHDVHVDFLVGCYEEVRSAAAR